MNFPLILWFSFSLILSNVAIEEKILRSINPMFLTRRKPLLIKRQKRQTTSEDCQFAVTDGIVDPCSLIINPEGLFLNPWQLGMGSSSNWIGGPNIDASENPEGGYAFVNTADKAGSPADGMAWMLTPPRKATGAAGQCLKFKYQINGINAKEISIGIFTFKSPVTADEIKDLPKTNPTEEVQGAAGNSTTTSDKSSARQLDSSAGSLDASIDFPGESRSTEDNDSRTNILFSNSDPQSPPLTSSTEKEGASGVKYTISKLWVQKDSTGADWKEASISFNSAKLHSIGFQAIADTRYHSYRGHIAVDNIQFSNGPCDNDCQFDKDFCAWKNAGNNQDDFDWSLGRSSIKRGTGPSRDHESTFIPGLETGGYAYIDSGYPRRPFDRAQLTSAEITAGDVPFCLTLWVHMYGGGIGTLRILKQVSNAAPVEIWNKEGSDLLDRWHMSQLTVTASKGSRFRVIVEGEVGSSRTGDIAIDTVTLKEGVCPGLPVGSGTGLSVADCTFFLNACEWTLQQPSTLTTSFTPMLVQSAGSAYTPDGHTQIFFEGKDYFMKFDLGNYKHRVRDSAFLISPAIKNDGAGICLSFWVYMFTNVPTETTVGSLSVIISTAEKNTTVWRLENQQHSGWIHSQVSTKETSPIQIYIQGTKGTKKTGMIGVDDVTVFGSECPISPPEAAVAEMDCSFDSDECRWKIESTKSVVTPPMDPNESWRYASDKFTIHVVTDHTYKIDKAGFMFIEAFNEDISSILISPTVDTGNEHSCFSFYFASFFADNTAQLIVSRRTVEGTTVTQWRVTQANLPPRPVGNVEVEWTYAQLPVLRGAFQLMIEGKVRTGGWAIDDIKLTRGKCLTRPKAANVLPPNGFPESEEPPVPAVTSEVGSSGGKVSSFPSTSVNSTELSSPSGVGLSDLASSDNSSIIDDDDSLGGIDSANETASSNGTTIPSSTNSTEEASSTEASIVTEGANSPSGPEGDKGSVEGDKDPSTESLPETGDAPATEMGVTEDVVTEASAR